MSVKNGVFKVSCIMNLGSKHLKISGKSPPLKKKKKIQFLKIWSIREDRDMEENDKIGNAKIGTLTDLTDRIYE